MCRNCQVASVHPWSRQVAHSAWTVVRRRRGGTTWTGRGECRGSVPSAGSRVWRCWMAGALCAGTWRRQVHDEPAPPDERGGVTAGHRPGPRGRKSPAARFRGSPACKVRPRVSPPYYVPPHSGTGFTGRAEPTAAELAPTAQRGTLAVAADPRWSNRSSRRTSSRSRRSWSVTLPLADDVADVGLRQAGGVRDGHLRDSRRRGRLRHAVGASRGARIASCCSVTSKWSYTFRTMPWVSTGGHGGCGRHRRGQGRRNAGCESGD